MSNQHLNFSPIYYNPFLIEVKQINMALYLSSDLLTLNLIILDEIAMCTMNYHNLLSINYSYLYKMSIYIPHELMSISYHYKAHLNSA